jgi:L-histidine N-alpha-methyltransferase
MSTTSPPHVEVHLSGEDLEQELAADVLAGLTSSPKSLPPRWLYDPRGCELFERITTLPEYYPTRAEAEILGREAEEIARRSGATTLIELGSGTSEKTRRLIDALRSAGTLERFVGFDVAEPTLRASLAELAVDHPELVVSGVVGDFQRHLGAIPAGTGRMVAFLGGTIGNLDGPGRAAFLHDLAGALTPGEHLLVGVDLVKDPARVVAAYNDSAGVTAAFETNVLAVVNRELGGSFDLSSFTYEAIWDSAEHRIEMGLRSDLEQLVAVEGLDLKVELAAGELVRTEISTKFTREGLTAELVAGGFAPVAWWTDTAGDFALALARVEAA